MEDEITPGIIILGYVITAVMLGLGVLLLRLMHII